MPEEKKPAPAAEGSVVEVQIVDLAGYVPGVKTSLSSRVAERLIAEGRVKPVGEKGDKSNKIAPSAGSKK